MTSFRVTPTKDLSLANLIISRHGQTKLNALVEKNSGVSYVRWEDDSKNHLLTDFGKKQACELAHFLSVNNWTPEIVITSTSQRTIETADLILGHLTPLLQSPKRFSYDSLCEICCSEFLDEHIPGHCYTDIMPDAIVREDVANILRSGILFDYKDRNVLFIGHEILNTYIIDYIENKSTAMNIKNVQFPNCSIYAAIVSDKM